MTKNNSVWSSEAVAARFEEAVATARRLPAVRVQGHFNSWPTILRHPWEIMSADEPQPTRFPPDPKAVDRMLEAIRWIQCLDVEQRHLIWMRAQGYRWHDITRRFGCDRTTAWRRWQRALQAVADHANCGESAAPKNLGNLG